MLRCESHAGRTATGDRGGLAPAGRDLESPLTVQGGHVGYLHKEIDGRHFWFFTNSSDTLVDTTVCLRRVYSLEQWNPHTGRTEPWPATTSAAGTSVQPQLAPVSSVFFVSDKDE